MTQQSSTNLKGKFGTGDVPDGNDYADFIDSGINVIDTSAQSITSPISAPQLTVTLLTANSAFLNSITGSSAQFSQVSSAFYFGSLYLGSSAQFSELSAANSWFDTAHINNILVSGTMSFPSTFETTVKSTNPTPAGAAVPVSADGFLVVLVNGQSKRIPFFKP